MGIKKLMEAVGENDIKEVARILDDYPDLLDQTDPREFKNIVGTDMTPLHVACRLGFTEGVRFLLKKGASVTKVSESNFNAADFAKNCGDLESIKLILVFTYHPDAGSFRGLADDDPAVLKALEEATSYARDLRHACGAHRKEGGPSQEEQAVTTKLEAHWSKLRGEEEVEDLVAPFEAVAIENNVVPSSADNSDHPSVLGESLNNVE
jgi:hypothetical protein